MQYANTTNASGVLMFNVQMTFNNAGLFQLVNQLRDAGDSSKVTLEVATSLLPIVHDRIHVEGEAADGQKIGEYSDAYMKVRTGNYSNNKITRGKNEGEYRKGSGLKSKSRHVTFDEFDNGTYGMKAHDEGRGEARPNYNRGNSTRVIASLTRAMENSFVVVATTDSSYGLGYLNKLSYDKSQWVEATYKGREIFSLTEAELNLITPIVYTYLKSAVS